MRKLWALLLWLNPLAVFAAKVPLVSHSHVYGTIAANQTVYIPVGDTVISSSTVEAHQQMPFYKAGTFSGMYLRLEENNLSGDYTCSLRINGVTGNSTVTLAAGVKIGTDTTHTDHINSGDKVNYVCTTGAGTNVLPVAHLINFAPDDGSYYQRFSPAAPAGGYLLTNGYQPYYSNITGIMGQNFYDHHTFHVMRTSGTFQKLEVYVSTNARINPTHIYLYKNGSNSALALTIPAGQWGLFENTTSQVNVVVGDTVTIKIDGVDGADSNPLNFRLFGLEFINSTGLIEWSLGTDDKPQNAGDTYTMPMKSALTFGGDEYLMQANSTGTLSNVCVYIGQNDVSTISTVKVRKDGSTSAGITVTIPAASTGTFCDNSGSVSFVSTTTLGFIGNSPAGTGTLYYSSIMGKATIQSEALGAFSIEPAVPVIRQSATQQFSAASGGAGTWTCSGTNSTGGVTSCSGSIDSVTGIYTAPSVVNANHVYGGIQVFPNNSIWNVRIDTLPVHANNAALLSAATTYGAQINWPTDFPINYVDGSYTETKKFNYTPLNDGVYAVPRFPDAKAENGWFNALQNRDGGDHHVIMVSTGTGYFSEFYQHYPNCVTTSASVTSNVATVTCANNPLDNGFLVGQTVVVGGFTGGDTYFNRTSTVTTAVTSTSISYALVHANASASTNGSVGKAVGIDTTGLMNSASGIIYSSMTYELQRNNGTDAAGMPLQGLILGYQEFQRAAINGGDINHGMRTTLALAVNASSNTWPATTYATDGGTIPFGSCYRLKSNFSETGFSSDAKILLRNQKRYCTFTSDGGINLQLNAESTRWSQRYLDAVAEIAAANIGANIEFVDISSIRVSTASSLTKLNREIVTFTRTADGTTASVDVALMGPAVNFKDDQINIKSGTPAIQIQVLNNYGGYSCTMSPSTGTLTSGCMYTPPTVSVATTTTITATSLINSSATAITTLTVFPSTGIYVIPPKTSDYVDSAGNTWVARAGVTQSPNDLGCCACDSSGSFAGTDAALFNCQVANPYWGGDTHLDFYVENGTYRVTYNYGTVESANNRFVKLSAGDTEIAYNLDPAASVGQFGRYISSTTVVTNNLLKYGIWGMNSTGAPISSLSVILVSSSSATADSYPTAHRYTGMHRFTGTHKFGTR